MIGLHQLVNELGEIDAKELATFPVGGPDSGIVLRVGRYGPYLEGPGDEATDGEPARRARERARRPAARRADADQGARAARPTRPARRSELGVAPRHRPAGRGEERPLRPLRHRGRCPRTRQEVAKPRTGSLFKSMSLDTVSLDDAVKLLSLPRVVGTDAEGVEITAQNGRYGPYLKKGTDSRSLTSEDQLLTHHPGRGAGDLRPAQAARARRRGAAAEGARRRPGLRAARSW